MFGPSFPAAATLAPPVVTGLRPGLGLEPWLAGPPLSTLSHALPGFMAHPQTPYASYLPSSVTSSLGLSGLVTMSQAACLPCFPGNGSTPAPVTPPTAASSASSPAAPTSPAASEDRISPGRFDHYFGACTTVREKEIFLCFDWKTPTMCYKVRVVKSFEIVLIIFVV